MTTASSPIVHPQKIVHQLLTLLHGASRPVDIVSSSDDVITLSDQLISIYEQRIEELSSRELCCDEFEREWSSLTWPLLSILNRMIMRTSSSNEHRIQLQLNTLIVSLVNKSRQSSPPIGISENSYIWANFWRYYSQALQVLHELYSQIDCPSPSLEKSLNSFAQNELHSYLEAFRELCLMHSGTVLSSLRSAQVDRMTNMGAMDKEPVRLAVAYYSNLQYTLGVIAARIQGFRFESLQTKYVFSVRDPVRPLMDMVFSMMEQLVCDCLLATTPSSSAILVTNNLFPFNCGPLAQGIVFKQFDVQIVSEETALSVQSNVNLIRTGSELASRSFNFPSAALLAMKPTSGVKRNNATANAEGGGNTAHKKSDVNSKELVTILPTWSEKYSCWKAQYPHLLCTTRQKDTVLLDTRSGQMGKRPLFYFYIKGTIFSPSGNISYTHTLSLPFTIATRRNQDCQVQRMMSSYTATCFWLYGIHVMDGLILNWCEAGIEWSRFVHLYRSYFSVNAEVSRTLSDDDFRLLDEKLECDDCREPSLKEGERMVTFKNVLCPHLRYDTEQTQMRFSIWRGLLEVLQIFQDARTNVKQLWDDYILHGFNDISVIDEMLLPHTSVMCLRISYVIGGSICVSFRSANRQVVHLEPVDLKKLQAKSVFDYMADIAESAKIDYVLTARLELISISDLIAKYKIGSGNIKIRQITTNITHSGPTEKTTQISFTPLRIAVVTCNPQQTSSTSLDSPVLTQSLPTNGYSVMNGNGNIQQSCVDQSFEAQLDHLMKIHGKSGNDVLNVIGYQEPQYNNQYLMQNNHYG